MLLLDTCTLVWLASEPDKLSGRAGSALRENRGNLFVSAISGFEIAQKVAKRKLLLPLQPPMWLEQILRSYGLQSLDLGMEAAVMAGGLKRLHDDPFDRLLIATAQVENLTLVTPDERIRQYPSPLRTLW